MKRSVARVLQVTVLLTGIAVFAFLLWEPTVEGRNLNSTLFEIYFKDPFLAFVYVASIPFFIGVYQTYKVLSQASKGSVHAPAVVKSLQLIKKCAVLTIGLAVVGEGIIMSNTSEDRAGGIFMGGLVILSSLVVVMVAARLLRTANTRSSSSV